MFDSPNTAPVFRRAVPPCNRTSGFTLIELLTVIAIIAILAAISFGVFRGVSENSARSLARAELSSLSVALESYKRQYGDYPQVESATDANANVLQALIGRRGPTGADMTRKALIEFSKFSVNGDPETTSTATLQDPWGRDYHYHYRTVGSATWTNPSYVLYSLGPDGLETAPTGAGVVDFDDSNNLDNLYANR